MALPQDFTGVDIAKNWIDVHALSTGRAERIAATPTALRRFAGRARGAHLVFEASGGDDRPLIEALERSGVRFSRVNPRQAREFARAFDAGQGSRRLRLISL